MSYIGKFGRIEYLFSFVIDHQEKRLFYNLQPSIYNVNQILIQVVNGFRKCVVNRVEISTLTYSLVAFRFFRHGSENIVFQACIELKNYEKCQTN